MSWKEYCNDIVKLVQFSRECSVHVVTYNRKLTNHLRFKLFQQCADFSSMEFMPQSFHIFQQNYLFISYHFLISSFFLIFSRSSFNLFPFSYFPSNENFISSSLKDMLAQHHIEFKNYYFHSGIVEKTLHSTQHSNSDKILRVLQRETEDARLLLRCFTSLNPPIKVQFM